METQGMGNEIIGPLCATSMRTIVGANRTVIEICLTTIVVEKIDGVNAVRSRRAYTFPLFRCHWRFYASSVEFSFSHVAWERMMRRMQNPSSRPMRLICVGYGSNRSNRCGAVPVHVQGQGVQVARRRGTRATTKLQVKRNKRGRTRCGVTDVREWWACVTKS